MLPTSRPNLEEIRPYKPGKPVEQVIRELKLKGPVDKLASNENPVGPSPKALAALRKELKNIYYYPEDSCYLLREKLAKRYKVDMDSVMVSSGSVELILLSCLAYLDPGDELVMTGGSFLMAKIGARIMNARLVEVPPDNYCHDLERILEHVTDRTRIVYLDNPINPLGTMVTKDKLGKFIKELPEHVLLVLDEAYAEYITAKKYPNSMDYFKAGRNILILRTFSKVYGLAGLRVGYGLAKPGILQTIGKVRTPFNVNRAAQAAAVAALDDKAHVTRSRRNNEAGKKVMYKEFEKHKVFYLPSFTNFIFVNFPVDSDIVFGAMQKRGVITRPVKMYGFPNALRVSIGAPPQNRRFVKALGEVMQELHGVK
jgi:histidinol-phosphate aminotransferase